MLDGLLKDQIRNDGDIAGMLTRYNGNPAFFYQKAPQDTDPRWEKPCFPRADYTIDMTYDPERKTAGLLTVHVWSSTECMVMPEDIEMRLIELINGTFYTPAGQSTTCALWQRSEQFELARNAGQIVQGETSPEVFGITILFDLLMFPEQLTVDPDPVQGLNRFTKTFLPNMTIIACHEIPPIWRPSNGNPAIYWRFEGATANDRQSYAVNWYTGQFAAHVITDNVTERNRWQKALIELIQIAGEIILVDGSPMFVKQIGIRHNSDPLREGQLFLSGLYGVLAQHRKEYAQIPLNNAILSEEPAKVPLIRLEVNAHDIKQ
jgi:hypothetical protein